MSWWRTNIAQQKLGKYEGTQDGVDGPVALFSMLDDKDHVVGLTMQDLGDLHEEHQHLLSNTVTGVFASTVQVERVLIATGAISLNRQHGVPFDPRLETPPQIEHGVNLTTEGRAAFSGLMNRLTGKGSAGPA